MTEQRDDANIEVITAFNQIPYNLLSQEVQGQTSDLLAELTEIQRYYVIYNKGAKFQTEGTHGDYTPAQLRYKLARGLINKQARFLFSEAPDIIAEQKGDVGKITNTAKDALTVLNDLLRTVFDANRFENALVKAAKDCFIGKRVAGIVNFNEQDGITVSFLPSTQFIYETQIGNPNVLTRFVAFMIVQDGVKLGDKKIMRKRLTLENGIVSVEETIFDGAGNMLEELTPKQETLLTMIPAVVFLNDGLSGDTRGESEINVLSDFEMWFSKLANADKDAHRKGMNQITYTLDMNPASTEQGKLKRSPGSHWDLGSDQNLEKSHPQVGTINTDTSYSPALQTTLERIYSVALDQVDMPMITLNSIKGNVGTGKALKAIYWPLIVRCKEKMKTWGPGLRALASIIIDGSYAYPNVAAGYVSDKMMQVEYEIKIDQNHPLPEDEQEEKSLDLAEVAAETMSRKSYMKKWRSLTDDECEAELKQIAYEKQMIDDHIGFQDTDVGIIDEVVMDEVV